MASRKNKIITLIVVMVAVICSVIFVAGATDDASEVYYKVVPMDVDDYRREGNLTAPDGGTGYIFAGWFKEKECETAIPEDWAKGPAYAKFVPSDILGLKAQVNTDLTDNDTNNDDKGSIRFLTSVDTLDYSKVGFKITRGTRDEEDRASSTVYETVDVTNIDVGETTSYKPANVFHASSQFFKAWTYTNVPGDAYNMDITVTPYWITLDGTTVKAETSIKCVNMGRQWKFIFVDDKGNDATGTGTRDYPYATLDAALDHIKKYGKSEGGEVWVLNSLTADSNFAWSEHGLDVTIKGDTDSSTIDFSAIANLKMGDAATFADISLVFPKAADKADGTGGTIYANGHRLEIAEKVTTTNTPEVFGGSNGKAVESTHVTLCAGNYAKVYGGGKNTDGNTNGTVNGDTYVYVGGNVNRGVLTDKESDLHNDNNNYNVFGGGFKSTVSGDTHVIIGGSAIVNYVRGGGSGDSKTAQKVEGNCYVNFKDKAVAYGVNGGGATGSVNNTYVVVSGGTIYQLVGGMTTSGGTVQNTCVQVLDGTIKRRIFGGNYNDIAGSGGTNAANGFTSVTIGNEAKVDLDDWTDSSLCAISRLKKNADSETGVLVLNSSKRGISYGWKGAVSSNARPTDVLVKVDNGGTATAEGTVLRITPEDNASYAVVKDENGEKLFTCQGEGTCPLSVLGKNTGEIQNITVTFSSDEEFTGDYVLSYGDDSYSYFDTLSNAIAAVSTPNTDGAERKTATITIGEETCTVDATIALTDNDNVVLKNKGGVNVTIKRASNLTDANMFDVAQGCALTIDGTITVDGNGVTGPSLINNAGEFTLKAGATLQNADAGTEDGGALYNTGTADLYGNMTGNRANEGGAIKNEAGSITIHSGTYSDNKSTKTGGVIHSGTAGNKVTIEGGVFYGNEAQNNTAGVIYCSGILTITGGEYYENEAASGGGVLNVGGTATVANAVMYNNSLTKSSNAGGAIYISANQTLTLEKCNIYNNHSDYIDNTNPGCDISLGASTTLNLKNNVNVGEVLFKNKSGIINIQETYTGEIILIPQGYSYEIGSQLVNFEAGIAEKITVRQYVSEEEYYDETYCVDTDGLLQYKNAEAKIGRKTYLTLAEAVVAASSEDTVYVLKDIELDKTIAIGDDKNITIANVSGKDITITRTSGVSMFTVASGSALTIGSEDKVNKLILDGGDSEGASLISNAGEFTLQANATIQNANAGTSDGGAIYNTGTITLSGTLTGNKGKNGGVIYSTGAAVTITGGTYTNNIATSGGGVIYSNNANAVVTIENGTFECNEAQGATGGVIYGNATTKITGGTFRYNSAKTGGGVLNVAVTATIANATMYNNSLTDSSYAGGAIYVSGKRELTLENCNIYDNNSNYIGLTNPGCDISLGGNTTTYLKNNINVGVVHLRYDNNGGIGTINVQETYTGKMTLIPCSNKYTISLQLVTFAAGTESSAENITVRKYASQTVYDDDTYCVDTDGLLQYKSAEAKIGTITYPTLADAIAVAGSEDVVSVLKDIELSKTIAIGDNKNITIANASGKDITLTRTSSASMFTVAGGSTLTIGNADTANQFILDGGYVAEDAKSLTGASLINNAGEFILQANTTIQNASAGTSDGGAIYNTGTITLSGTLSGNRGKNGGAVYSTGEAVTVTGGTYTNNIATSGGGVIYSNNENAKVTIKDGIFEYNEAQGATGGVIYGKASTEITGGTFQYNMAKTGAGVMNVAGSCEAKISNAIIQYNYLTASEYAGGAFYVSGSGALELEKSTVRDNIADGDYVSAENPGCDISLGGSTNLNLKDNTKIGVIFFRNASGKVNIQATYTGQMILVPQGYNYKINSQLVTFAAGTESSAENIIVRKYASQTEYNDDTYCVDAAGTLQYNSNTVKVGTQTYLTLSEAVAAVETSEETTIYVLYDADISETVNISDGKNITVTNMPGMDVTLQRATGLTTELFNVANGSTLNITGAVTVDGKNVETPNRPLVRNSGTFTLGEDATLTGGNAGTSVNNYNGGALNNAKGATAILAGNVTNSKAYNGGGIYNAGSLIITGGEYSGNTGNQGGVLHSTGGSLDIQAGNFTGNSASANGGVMNVNNNATISNAVMTGNSVTGSGAGGAAIYFRGNYTLELKNCDISNNTLVYVNATAPGSDIALGDTTPCILRLYNNINVGVVHWRYNGSGAGKGLAQVEIVKSEEFDEISDYSAYLGNIALRQYNDGKGNVVFGKVIISSDFDSIKGAREAIVDSIIAHKNITSASAYEKYHVTIDKDGTITIGDMIAE